MRLTGLHVDGFGALHDTGVSGLAPGLTLVHGDNGAGKSSLHAFVVRVLFGIPRSNAVDVVRHFEPLRGGRHGGRLELLDDDGAAWTITRVKGGSPTLHVHGPQGESTSHDALVPLLGELDRTRFEQLFAIDLARLVGSDDLPGEQLQRLLFDAATLGTAGSLRGARDLATERADALYLPSGRVQPVAEARRRRGDLEQQLRAARAEVARLSGLRDAVAQADAERDRLADEVERVDRELAALQRSTELEDEHARLRARRDELVLDDRLAAVADDVARLHARLPVHHEREERLAAARERARTAAAAAEAALARVGPDWDAERVAAVAVDGTSADRLRDAAQAAEKTAEFRDGLAGRVHEAEVRVERLSARLGAAGSPGGHRLAADADAGGPGGAAPGAGAPDEVPGGGVVDGAQRRAEAVALLRSRLPVLDLADAVATGAADRSGPQGDPAAPPRSGLLLAAALLATLGGIAFVVALAGGDLLGAAAVVLVAAALWILRDARDRRAGPGPTPGPDPAEVERARRDVATAAGVLGLPERPGHADLARAEALLREDEAAAAEARRRRTELEDLEAELVDLRAELERAEGATAAAGTELDRVKGEVGLPAAATVGLPPASLVDLHGRVADAARALAEQQREDAEVQRLAGEVAAFEDEALALVAADGPGGGGLAGDGAAAVRRLEALAAAADEDRAARAEAARLDAELERVGAALEQQAATLREVADRAPGPGTPDAEGTPEVSGGHGTPDAAAREARVRRLEEQRAELTDRRDELLAERTRAQQRLEELGGDDTIPDLDQRVAMVEQELADLVERWSVLALARDLLDAAVEHFESQQQPVVLEEASRLLGRFTRGAWTEVRQVDQLLYALRAGSRDLVPAQQLSTGEQAQLYLALRVALAGMRGPTLPLLLDDLLGSADDARGAAIVTALAELAAERQVLLFTPSATTVERARALVPDAGVLELADGRIVAADPGTVTAAGTAT